MAFVSIEALALSENQVGVALSSGRLDGGHIGLAFISSKDGPKLMHLAFHRRLLVDNIPVAHPQCWVVSILDIPKGAAKAVSAGIRSVATRLPIINYGIDFIAAKGSFVRGLYKAPKGSDGLTCSSFVVDVLRSVGVNLIDDSTWKASEENVEWGNKVVELLTSFGASAEHIESVKSNSNGLRLIPFEVGAAADAARHAWPLAFENATAAAVFAKAELEVCCPLPLPKVSAIVPSSPTAGV